MKIYEMILKLIGKLIYSNLQKHWKCKNKWEIWKYMKIIEIYTNMIGPMGIQPNGAINQLHNYLI